MLLPFREASRFRADALRTIQAKEGIPIVKGNVVTT